MNILLLIGGLILILLGANGLTDGAASVAKRFRIHRYRTDHCRFRHVRSGTDGECRFSPERKRGHCHR
jgi:serine/threonine-protein kinase RIO1